MRPSAFLAEVVTLNVQEANASPSLRTAFNAILTLDALAGIIHAQGKASGLPEMARHATDEPYKAEIAAECDAFRLVRDIAASTKHGELTRDAGTRLVTKPSAVQAQTFGAGLGFGPISGAPISGSTTQVFIVRNTGGPLEGVGLVLEVAHAALRAIVEGLPSDTLNAATARADNLRDSSDPPNIG